MRKPNFLPQPETIWRHTVNLDGTHARRGEPQPKMSNLVRIVVPGSMCLDDCRISDMIPFVKSSMA